MNERWGQLVRARRRSIGMTQVALAAATGVDQTAISKVEVGKVTPSDDLRLKIAAALGVKVADLFPYPEVAAS